MSGMTGALLAVLNVFEERYRQEMQQEQHVRVSMVSVSGT